jgi:uncharacterized protein
MAKNAVHWFEIPVLDLDRAVRFYSQVLGVDMIPMNVTGSPMAMFPAEGVGGALIQEQGTQPSVQGTLVYLDCGCDLSGTLQRVATAGGRVALPKTSIGKHGFIGLFIDTEGNRVGLHATE